MRAAPAGVRGTDHPRLLVGKKHRRTVGRDNRQGKTGFRRHNRIGNRTALGSILPGFVNGYDVGRMDLMRRDNLCARHQRFRCASAQSRDRLSFTWPTKTKLMRSAR